MNLIKLSCDIIEVSPHQVYTLEKLPKSDSHQLRLTGQNDNKIKLDFLVFLLVLQLAIIFQYCTATADHKMWQKVHFWVQSLLFSFSLPSLLFSKTIKKKRKRPRGKFSEFIILVRPF